MRVMPVALAALALSSAPAAAQEPLDAILDTLAALWAAGDAAGLAEHGAEAGTELEILGEPMGLVGPRKLAPALRRVFATQQTISVVPRMGGQVEGAEDRAFAELRWEVRSVAGAVPEHNTVFVALVREDRRWRVSQIRILR